MNAVAPGNVPTRMTELAYGDAETMRTAAEARNPLRRVVDADEVAAAFAYLASDDAQRYFADGNNEWPAVPSVKVANPALQKLGPFKADTLPVGSLGMYRAKAQMIFDRVGYR